MKKISCLLLILFACGPAKIADDEFTHEKVKTPTGLQLLPLPVPEIKLAKDAEYLNKYTEGYFSGFDSILKNNFNERGINIQEEPTRFTLTINRILVSEKTANDSPVNADGSESVTTIKTNSIELRINCTITDTKTGKSKRFEGGYVKNTFADKDMLTGIVAVERGGKTTGDVIMANTLNYLRGMSARFINKQAD